MKARFTLLASIDLDGVLDHVGQHSPRGAGRIRAGIEAATMLLERHPRIGRRTTLPWLRRLKVSRYPYFLLYEVTDSEIVVHAVRHSARDPSTSPGGS